MIFLQRYSHQLFTLQSWSAWVFLLQSCIWGQYQLGREGIPWIIMAELEASSVRLGSSTTTFDIIFKWSSAFLEMYHS
ncbi:Uncharacterized protein TCM_023860 [Theobroma cacao]|uniref:Uncharacterized protein n=1 Tax=Theobroma cacao TaxID=3641 RepID=A0A061F2L5_THECC|nr:Uncharacterized protein TCM_023860 [Theobroma cacao]